jgi:hypothetical protein
MMSMRSGMPMKSRTFLRRLPSSLRAFSRPVMVSLRVAAMSRMSLTNSTMGLTKGARAFLMASSSALTAARMAGVRSERANSRVTSMPAMMLLTDSTASLRSSIWAWVSSETPLAMSSMAPSVISATASAASLRASVMDSAFSMMMAMISAGMAITSPETSSTALAIEESGVSRKLQDGGDNACWLFVVTY